MRTTALAAAAALMVGTFAAGVTHPQPVRTIVRQVRITEDDVLDRWCALSNGRCAAADLHAFTTKGR